MSTHQHYFVTSASIAAELEKAIIVAKQISLASSNAGVLAVRAGTDAAGFGALAEFLDQLARKTIGSSNDINKQAMEMSQLTSMAVRTQSALDKYELVTEKAEEAEFVDSLSSGHRVIRDEVKQNTVDVKKETQLLNRRLEELKQDLDVGKVLASMSLVEASQAGKEFSSQLSDNARNIASAIERIEIHVVAALSLLKKAEKTL